MGSRDVQLQEREVGIGIVFLFVALMLNVILEDGRRLGIVSIEAIEDGVDVIWPTFCKIERNAHLVYLLRLI